MCARNRWNRIPRRNGRKRWRLLRVVTESQVRKPLLGSGHAVPIGFATPLTGTLLLASDGLWKYVQRKRIAAIALQPDLTRHRDASSMLRDCSRETFRMMSP